MKQRNISCGIVFDHYFCSIRFNSVFYIPNEEAYGDSGNEKVNEKRKKPWEEPWMGQWAASVFILALY